MAEQVQRVKLAFSADTSQVQKELKNLEQELQQIVSANSKSFGLNTDLEKAAKSAQDLGQAIQKAFNYDTGKLDFSAFSKSLGSAKTNLEQVAENLRKLGPAGQSALSSLSTSLAAAEIPLKRTQNLLTQFGNTLKNTVKWEISSNIVHGLEGAFSHAISYAENLNKTLTSIRQVSGASLQDMVKFTQQANAAAKTLAVSTKAYADASLIYYQQGDSADLAAKKAQITLKATNAAFTASAEEMSEMLTATWNAYQVGSDQLEHYVDVMAKLGATTATSVEEIATSLQKVAATANTVGVGIEQMSSMIATVSSVTRQSAETIGTSMNTILSRIGGLKLGETLEDGVDLNKYSSALKSVGVNVLDVTGQLRNMGDVITDLGNRWSTLSKGQQSALAQTIGGTRQYTNLMALFENWDKYQMNLNNAQNSNGALQQMQNVYAESWEAASKRVQAAFEGIFNQIIDSDFMTKMTNVFAGMIEQVDSLVKGFGGLPGILSQISLLMTNSFGDKIQGGIANMVKGISNIKDNFGQGFTMLDLITGRMPSREQNQLSQNLKVLSGQKTTEANKVKGKNDLLSSIYKDQSKYLTTASQLQLGLDENGKRIKKMTEFELGQRIDINQQRLNHLTRAEMAALNAYDIENGDGTYPGLDDWLTQVSKRTKAPESTKKHLTGYNNNVGYKKQFLGGELFQSLDDAFLSLSTEQTEGANDSRLLNLISRMQSLKSLSDRSGLTSQLDTDSQKALDSILKMGTDKKIDQDVLNTAIKTLLGNDDKSAFAKKSEQFKSERNSNEGFLHLDKEDQTDLNKRLNDWAKNLISAYLEEGMANEQDLPDVGDGIDALSEKIGKFGQEALVAVESAGIGFSNLQNIISSFKTDDITQQIGAVVSTMTGFAQAMQGGIPGMIAYGVGAIAGYIANWVKAQEQMRLEQAKVQTAQMDSRNNANTEQVTNLDTTTKSFNSLKKQFEEGSISANEYQQSLFNIASSLGIQNAAVLNLTGSYKQLEAAVQNALQAQLEQARIDAIQALSLEQAGIQSRWTTVANQNPLSAGVANGQYYVRDVLDQVGNGFFNVTEELVDQLKSLGLINKEELPYDINEYDDHIYYKEDLLAALLGGKVSGYSDKRDDDLVLEDPEAAYEQLLNLQKVAASLPSDTDLGKKLNDFISSSGFRNYLDLLNQTTGSSTQLRKNAWTASANKVLLGTTVDTSQYTEASRDELIAQIVAGFNVEDKSTAIQQSAKELATNAVDNFIAGLNAEGAIKTAEYKTKEANYNTAKKNAEKFGINTLLPDKNSDVWKYMSSAMMFSNGTDWMNKNQSQLANYGAYQQAMAAVTNGQNLLSNEEFDLTTSLQNIYTAAESLGYIVPVKQEDLGKLSTEEKASLYNKILTFFENLLNDPSMIDSYQQQVAELLTERDKLVVGLNQEAQGELKNKYKIDGINEYDTVDSLYSRYLDDRADENRKGLWTDDAIKFIEQQYEKYIDLMSMDFSTNMEIKKPTKSQTEKNIDWLRDADLNPLHWSADQRDQYATEMQKRGYSVTQLMNMSDLERAQVKVAEMTKELNLLKQSADADATSIQILTKEIENMQSEIDQQAFQQMQNSVNAEAKHWEEVQSAADSALSLITSKMQSLDQLSFPEIEKLRQDLLNAGVAGEEVAKILQKIKDMGKTGNDSHEDMWQGLMLMTNAALAEITSIQAQAKGVENLASQETKDEIAESKEIVKDEVITVKKIDVRGAEVNPSPIPVEGEAKKVVVPDNTVAEGTVEVEAVAPKVVIPTENVKVNKVTLEGDILNQALAIAESVLPIDKLDAAQALKDFKAEAEKSITVGVSKLVADHPELVDSNGTGIAAIPVEAYLSFLPEVSEEQVQTDPKIAEIITNFKKQIERLIQTAYGEQGYVNVPINLPTQILPPDNLEEVKTNTENELIVKLKANGFDDDDIALIEGATATQEKIIKLILDVKEFQKALAKSDIELFAGSDKSNSQDLGWFMADLFNADNIMFDGSNAEKWNNTLLSYEDMVESFETDNLGAITGITKKGIDNLFTKVLEPLTNLNNMEFDENGDFSKYTGEFAQELENIKSTLITLIEQDLADGELTESLKFVVQGIWALMPAELQNINWGGLFSGLGANLLAALNAELGIASPSKLTMTVGPWIIAGLEVGLQQAVANWDPSASFSGVGAKLMKALQQEIKDSNLVQVMQDVFERTKIEDIKAYDAKHDNEISNLAQKKFQNYMQDPHIANQTTADNIWSQSYREAINDTIKKNAQGRFRNYMQDPHIANQTTADNIWAQSLREAQEEMYGNAMRQMQNAGEDLETSIMENYYKGEHWNKSKDFNRYEKVAISQIYKEALAEADETVVQDGVIKDFDKFAQLMTKKVDEQYTTYVNQIEDVWARLKEGWKNVLVTRFNDEDVQKEYYDSWVKTFSAIAKARDALLSGVSVLDNMADDPEALGQIIKQLMERGWTGSDIQSFLSDPNANIDQLLFGDYDKNSVFRGDNRWLNQDENGYVKFGQTYEEYTQNRQQDFEDWLREDEKVGGQALLDTMNSNDIFASIAKNALGDAFSQYFSEENGQYSLADQINLPTLIDALLGPGTVEALAEALGGYKNQKELDNAIASAFGEQIANEHKAKTAELNEYLKIIGLTKEELYDYAEQQKQLGTITGETTEELLKNAAVLYRQTKGFDDAEKNMKNYMKELAKFDEGTNEWTKQAEKIRDIYADLFDLSPAEANKLSNAFLKSTENAKLLEKAMKGDEKAWDDLTAAAAKDILSGKGLNLSVDDQQVLSQISSLIPNIQSYLDANKLEVGADLNAAPFMSQLQSLEFASMEAAQAATAALSAIGVEAEVSPVTYTVPGHTEVSKQDGDWTIGPITVPVHNTLTTTVAPHKRTIFKIKGATYNGRGVTNGGASHNVANTGGGGGGGGGSKPKHKEYKGDEEIERYHQINRQIEYQERLLKRVNLLKQQRYGLGYLRALEQENAELMKHIELVQRRAGPGQAGYWLEQAKQTMAQFGATYDSTGQLNYRPYMFNILDFYNQGVDQYNAMVDSGVSEEEAQEWFDKNIQKVYDEAKEAISIYEEAMDYQLDSIEMTMEDLNKISANLKEMAVYKMKFEIELDEHDIKRLDFIIKRYDDYLDKQAESEKLLMKNIDLVMEDLDYTGQAFDDLFKWYHMKVKVFDENSKWFQSMTSMEEDLKKQTQSFLNDADYVGGLQEVAAAIMENLEKLEEYRKQMLEVYGHTIELAADKLENFTNTLEHHITMYDGYLEILDLISDGHEHYLEDIQLLNGAYTSSLTEIAIIREHLNVLLDQRQKLLTQMEDPIYASNEKIQKDFEALEERIEELEEQLLDATKTTLDKAKAMLDKTVESAVDKMSKLTNIQGTDVEWLSTQWDWWKEEQDQYVDRITQVYEVDKLVRDIEKSIADTRNKNNQAQLKALEDEIQLRSKNNALNEYSIEMMRLSYELLLAQQNLENANDSKDTVRLTRDDNGNYIYQYTADEDKITEAQQKYNDVLYEMNQTTKERYRDLVQSGIDVRKEELEQFQKIMDDTELSAEEKMERMQQIYEHYGNMLEGIDIFMDEVLQNMGENQLAWTNNMNENLMDTSATSKEQLTNLSNAARTQLNLMYDDTRVSAEKWKEGTQEQIDSVGKALKNYENQLLEVQKTSDITLQTMIKQITEYGKQATTVNDQASILAKTMQDVLDKLVKMNEQWISMDQKLQKVIDQYLKMHELIGKEQDEVAHKEYEVNVEEVPLTPDEQKYYYQTGNLPTGGNVGTNAQGQKTKQRFAVTDPVTGQVLGIFNTEEEANNWINKHVNGQALGGITTPYNEDDKNVQTSQNLQTQNKPPVSSTTKKTCADCASGCYNDCGSACDNDCKYGCKGGCKDKCAENCSVGCKDSCRGSSYPPSPSKGYATGGINDYTGLAWLDGTPQEPEYILNAEQTHEMFNILNDHTIYRLIDTMTAATQAMLSAMGLHAGSISTQSLVNSTNAPMTTYITAEFPNATDHNEIELALQNLVNNTAQSINRFMN